MAKMELLARDAYIQAKQIQEDRLKVLVGPIADKLLQEITAKIQLAVVQGNYFCTYERAFYFNDLNCEWARKVNRKEALEVVSNICTLLVNILEDAGYHVVILECNSAPSMKLSISWAVAQ